MAEEAAQAEQTGADESEVEALKKVEREARRAARKAEHEAEKQAAADEEAAAEEDDSCLLDPSPSPRD